ncbi:MAG: peroxiredoxin [Hyphomicrobiales bacterium]|nr:peroxiredoxin [Hyphomicrobiales bacterium]
MIRLENGDRFPSLTISALGGGSINLPEALSSSFGVVLIYRGAWCPYCKAQLAAFERFSTKFAEANIKVMAFSVDDEAITAALVAKHGLQFPVGYGVDAAEIAEATGAYVNDSPRYLQTTGFLLKPDMTVVNAVYSSAAIGRLVPEDVLGMVDYLKNKK